MENVIVATGIAVAVALGLVSLVVFRSFSRKASLCDAKVGQVFNFEYLQPLHGKSERYLAKVIEPVSTLDDSWIKIMNRRSNYRRNDPSFQRTNHLVTCQTADGNIRQFYCERAVNCRRPLLAGLFM